MLWWRPFDWFDGFAGKFEVRIVHYKLPGRGEPEFPSRSFLFLLEKVMIFTSKLSSDDFMSLFLDF